MSWDEGISVEIAETFASLCTWDRRDFGPCSGFSTFSPDVWAASTRERYVLKQCPYPGCILAVNPSQGSRYCAGHSLLRKQERREKLKHRKSPGRQCLLRGCGSPRRRVMGARYCERHTCQSTEYRSNLSRRGSGGHTA